MVATLAGFVALLLGLGLLTLPLLATELSRPGDSAWGALVLVLGLVLVTCADRLTGYPMRAVISAGLLIGRRAV
ncbi:MAG: Ycf66 family protein [Cyanobium sp.]